MARKAEIVKQEMELPANERILIEMKQTNRLLEELIDLIRTGGFKWN